MTLPLSTPGLAACAVILFVISWHELLIPLIVVSRPEAMTLPVILAGLVSDYFVFFTLMMAICLRDKACPRFTRLRHHNHISEATHLNTADESLGPEIIEFIQTLR